MCFVFQVNDIHLADACKITPAKFSGSKEVVPLEFRKQVSTLNNLLVRKSVGLLSFLNYDIGV